MEHHFGIYELGRTRSKTHYCINNGLLKPFHRPVNIALFDAKLNETSLVIWVVELRAVPEVREIYASNSEREPILAGPKVSQIANSNSFERA